MKTPKVIILRTAGTNCDRETVFAFQHFGAQADAVHINKLLRKDVSLEDYHIMAIPGGFTYGDDIISGKILANELRLKLGKDIEQFIAAKKLVIGICNGFQVLVRAGILPGCLDGPASWNTESRQTASLTYNDSGKFEDRWTFLHLTGRSVWTEDLPDIIYVPVAHAEGKFVAENADLLSKMETNEQIVFRYCTATGGVPRYPENPNGSIDHIAGIADKTGRVLGLMPHPERHFLFTQHPQWTRLPPGGVYGHGAKIFQNGINYVKENLLR